MMRRHSRHGPPARRQWAVFSLAALAVLAAAAWMAPTVLVLTPLRDRPLEAVFSGIDGSITSGAARWNWLGGIEYRDIVLRDRGGRACAIVPRLAVDRGLAALMVAPHDLGTVRLVGPEMLVDVRRGGSSLEDILAPWLAGWQAAGGPRGVACELEVVDGAVELIDLERHDAWRVSEVIAACSVRADGGLGGWTVAGRVRHVERADAPAAAAALAPAAGAGNLDSFDRAAVAAGATAVLARDGGWSVSSTGLGAAGREIAVAAHRMPLGVSSVAATRFAASRLVDGLADIRLDLTVEPQGTQAVGTIVGESVAVCHADTLAEIAAVERCELPFDLVVTSDHVTVRKLTATSAIVRAEASGRIGLPGVGSTRWAEDLVAEDFAVAAVVDLAAAARSLPGGLAVRPDVRVIGGTLDLAAASRADGTGRLLEVRLSARDLEAVQSVVAAAGGPVAAAPAAQERQLKWTEPFTGWLRGRRGAGRADPLVIEDARLTSAALELSAAGTAANATIQWSLDFDKLVADAAELLALEGAKLAGSSRGRIDVTQTDHGRSTLVKAAASLREFELALPGRPAWRDDELAVEVEASGRLAAGAAVVEAARAAVVSGEDKLEAAIHGGVVVAVAAVAEPAAVGTPWVRPLPTGESITADVSLAGDLGRWHARLAGLLPAAEDLELAGRVDAAVAVAAQGDVWRITRAGGEIEKGVLRVGPWRIAEPRVVASAAGVVHAATGRVELASAEILTPTLSVRSGGLAWLPPAAGPATVAESLRGKLQWQADLGRLTRWFASDERPSAWTAAGRGWGTLEIADTQSGLNVLAQLSGNDLVLTRAGGGAAAEVWREPAGMVTVELTRPRAAVGGFADGLRIDRLAAESSTLALEARGTVDEWSARRMLAVDGTLSYDWEQLSRLITPWTNGRLRLAGGGGRPFTIRGPLRPPAPAAAAPQETVATLPLPTEWLAATRGREPSAADRVAKLPVAPPPPSTSATDLWKGLSIDTSIAWQAADVAGLAFEPGELPLRFFEGQLALGPFDLGAAGGRLRGAPWLRLGGTPRELVVPPGRVAERVSIGPQSEALLAWLSPMFGKRTRAEGLMTLDLAGARVPLDEPFAGEAAGQLMLEQFEVLPNPRAEPLVNLLVKLQSAVDPRFAFGDKAVLLRVRPEPIRLRFAQRRLWHEGLVMDTGQFMVKSAGSVTVDGSLDMVVEIALRGDLVGQTPVVAPLVRTPLVIPLKGTVERPQFDARALETILGRIVENTAQAVLSDGIGRGLEALFGNPQPPPAAPSQPLILPPQPR